MAKRPRYDDEFRASALVMLEAQGWPDKKGALTVTATHLGIPVWTLSRLAKGSQNAPPHDLVSEKRTDLKALLLAEIQAALEATTEPREFASYRDLVTGIGILIDKLQLLEGKPTAINQDTVTVDDKRQDILSRLDGIATARRASGHPVGTESDRD